MERDVLILTEQECNILGKIADGYSVMVSRTRTEAVLLKYDGSYDSEIENDSFERLKRTRMISIRIKDEMKEIWY